MRVWAQVERSSDRPSLFVLREMRFSAAVTSRQEWRQFGCMLLETTALLCGVTQSSASNLNGPAPSYDATLLPIECSSIISNGFGVLDVLFKNRFST